MDIGFWRKQVNKVEWPLGHRTTFIYDQANRLEQVTQGANTYTFAYNGVGDRLSQTVGITTTRYVLDPAAGLTQVLADGTNTYLYGNARIGQYQTAMQYFGPDALGSVRQIYDSTGQVIGSTRYDPFGNVMSQGGTASVFAFAGEQYDATGLTYLRARYYSSAQGRFTTRDVWEGDAYAPMSYNAWNYTNGNPVNAVDPSGLQCAGPDCPSAQGGSSYQPQFQSCLSDDLWNCDAIDYMLRLKGDLLASAAQHNRPGSGLDNNSFAALTASVIVGERKVGNSRNDLKNEVLQDMQDLLVGTGCLTSGHLLQDALIEALTHGDLKTFLELTEGEWFNQTFGGGAIPPQLATVGIGNVSIRTAMNVRQGRACVAPDLGGACLQVDVKVHSPDIPRYPNDPRREYWEVGKQLLDDKLNVEYVSANLEAGIVRAKWLKAQEGRLNFGGPFDGPSVFNLAAWHAYGVQTDREIRLANWNPGYAMDIVRGMPRALNVLGLKGNYNPGVQYQTWAR